MGWSIEDYEMNYLVSVIIPVYNVENYLEKCINSVLNQSYRNYEILLIDDGSTDKSGIICDKYAKKYKTISTFHKKNSGLGLTRNYGLTKAKGKYVTFIDSDDYIKNDYLKKLISPILADSSIDTVIGGFVQVSNNGTKLYSERYCQKIYNGKEIKKNLFPRMLGSLPGIRDSIKPMVWNCLYSRKLIIEFGLKFVSEKQLISEDVVWDSDYFNVAHKAIVIGSTGYFYRYNSESLSRKYDVTRFARVISFYDYMSCKLKKYNLGNEAQIRLKKGFFVALAVCIAQTKKLSISSSIKEINHICKNEMVNEYISTYPIDKLNFKQHFFICLVKNRCSLCLTLLSRLNLVHS